MKTLIIGGVAGGASAAARLRRLDESAEIILIERGPFISFANCGLPYFLGGTIADQEQLTLQTPESFHARFRVEVRVEQEALSIQPDAKTVTIQKKQTGDTYIESYDRLILSPGAAPLKPPIPGLDDPRIFTLRNIPDTLAIKDYLAERHPRSALIIGGGYIGLEVAENLADAGLRVSIAEMTDHVIGPLDADMAADVHHYLRQKGIRLLLNQRVQAVSSAEEGLEILLEYTKVHAEMVLLSTGVKPESDLAREAGIACNPKGAILVNERMETSMPGIYAVGDTVEVRQFVTGKAAFIPLAGPANRQGRIAADQIMGIDSRYEGTQGTAILKLFEMTVAATGLSEQAAKAAGLDYEKTYTFSPSHAGYYPGARNMSVKALWEKKTLRLIGVQIVGYEGVDKRMDVLAAAMRLGAKVTDLTKLELSYAPPFGSAKDPVNMLGFVAENVENGIMRQFFPEQVDALPRDGSVTLLDVRTPGEVARGRIPGFISIPLDSLREHLNEIPKDKPVYLHCHSGLRSYIGCRILTGYGYTCYNLAGGWRLYDAIHRDSTQPAPTRAAQ